jgi:UDP-2-acetamido-3-amino-2,3-dideoxy-glucuronate N-acetyltransferase
VNTSEKLPYPEMGFFVHHTAVLDEGCIIGEGTHIWHFSHIMPKATIGKHCTIGQNVMIADNVIVGNHVKIQNNVSMYDGVECEDDVFIGPSAVFTNVLNPRSAINQKGEFKKTIVRKGATIGANATIICGHEIGRYAFIGAGAVITKDVLPYALMAGNPAIQKGWISEHGCRLAFQNGSAVCTGTGDTYTINNNAVIKAGKRE